MKPQHWARIGRTENGYCMEITESKSPLANVIEAVPCVSRAAAEKAVSIWLKENGLTYGGRN